MIKVMITKIAPLDLSSLISVDEQGYPYAPNVYQIQDRDVRELYLRDTSEDKLQYLKEAGVIYYLADPKSPPNQMGYSRPEALESARVNYALPSDWQPDALILRLVDRYHEDKSGVAGEALETILRAIHNSSRAANIISERLTDKLNSGLQAEDALPVIDLVTKLNGIINIIPTQMKSLNEAKQAAALEIEQKKARGGKVVTSSMSAKDASDLEAQVEAQKRELGLISDSIVTTPLRGKYESTK